MNTKIISFTFSVFIACFSITNGEICGERSNDALLTLIGQGYVGEASCVGNGKLRGIEYVGKLAARLSRTDNSIVPETSLPTSDLFNPPKAVAILLVEGIGKETLESNGENAPILKELFMSNTIPCEVDQDVKLLRACPSERMFYALRHDFIDLNKLKLVEHELPAVHVASGREELSMALFGGRIGSIREWEYIARNNSVHVSYALDRKEIIENNFFASYGGNAQAEFALFEAVVKGAEKTASSVLAFGISSFIKAENQEDIESRLSEFDGLMGSLLETIQSQFHEETAIIIALTGSQKYTQRRILSSTMNYARGFEGWDFILMVWMSLILSIFLLLVFCCIPWSSTLDPMLTTTIKSNEHLKES